MIYQIPKSFAEQIRSSLEEVADVFAGRCETSGSVRSAQEKETVGSNGISDLLRRSWQAAPALLQGIVFLAMALSLGYAQTTSGAISGTVLDQQNAAVPQCPVTAVDQDRGSVQRTETDMAGYFVFRSLLPGRYTPRSRRKISGR